MCPIHPRGVAGIREPAAAHPLYGRQVNARRSHLPATFCTPLGSERPAPSEGVAGVGSGAEAKGTATIYQELQPACPSQGRRALPDQTVAWTRPRRALRTRVASSCVTSMWLSAWVGPRSGAAPAPAAAAPCATSSPAGHPRSPTRCSFALVPTLRAPSAGARPSCPPAPSRVPAGSRPPAWSP